jgi:hypothetical protein
MMEAKTMVVAVERAQRARDSRSFFVSSVWLFVYIGICELDHWAASIFA